MRARSGNYCQAATFLGIFASRNAPPLRTKLMPEPGRLPLGILPGRNLGACHRLVESHLAGDRRRSSRTPIAFMAGSAGSRPSAIKRPHLLQRAGFDHAVEARLDARDELRPLGLDHHELRAVAVDQRLSLFGLPFQDRAARRLQHLQRPHDALAVARRAASSRLPGLRASGCGAAVAPLSASS